MGPAPHIVSPAQPLPLSPEQALELSQAPAVVESVAREIASPTRPIHAPEPSQAAWIARSAIGPWVAAAWAGIWASYAAVVLLRIVKLRRAVRRATVPGEDLSQEVGRLARQMGLAVVPEVRAKGWRRDRLRVPSARSHMSLDKSTGGHIQEIDEPGKCHLQF